jgi:hypothetical protein
MPVPVAARSKAVVYGRSPTAIVGSNSSGSMDICLLCVCLCCQVEVSATSWSLVQRSPTDCGASLCVIKKPRELGGHSPRWAAVPEKIINEINNDICQIVAKVTGKYAGLYVAGYNTAFFVTTFICHYSTHQTGRTDTSRRSVLAPFWPMNIATALPYWYLKIRFSHWQALVRYFTSFRTKQHDQYQQIIWYRTGNYKSD